MLRISNLNINQNIRYSKDVIEPLAVSIIKRKNHTFFVHRCSDYIDIHHLASCHNYNLSKTHSNLFEKYWSAIDIVRFVVQGMPSFSKTKYYFDQLEAMLLNTKVIEDFQLYEVKLMKASSNLTVSYNTYQLQEELKKLDKSLIVFMVVAKGFWSLDTQEEELDNVQYRVRTHYGRKNYSLDLG